jgi:hypothetical protein
MNSQPDALVGARCKPGTHFWEPNWRYCLLCNRAPTKRDLARRDQALATHKAQQEDAADPDWTIIEGDGRYLTLSGPDGQEIVVDTDAPAEPVEGGGGPVDLAAWRWARGVADREALMEQQAAAPAPKQFAAPAETVGIPAGWKLVPITQTQEMRDAARRTAASFSGSDLSDDEADDLFWAALLNASPVAPAPVVDRAKLNQLLGSWTISGGGVDDDDHEVLHDLFPGDYHQRTGRLDELTDAIIALLNKGAAA